MSSDSEVLRDKALKLYFEKNALSLESWNRSADRLLEAAALIEPELRLKWREIGSRWRGEPVPLLGLHGTRMLIMGFAIENLMKGILVTRLSASEIKRAEGGDLPTFLKTHDLTRLAAEIGLALTERQAFWLWRLTRFSTFAGRYPVPLCHEAVMADEPPHGSKLNAKDLIDGDFEVPQQIIDLLRAIA
jgi:hypothetical protein